MEASKLSLLVALFVMALAACGGPGEYCMPGFVRDCTCTSGASGTQRCDSMGNGFSACSCGNDGGTDAWTYPDEGVVDTGVDTGGGPNCALYTSCDTCVPQTGCGWCGSFCTWGTSAGSVSGSCTGAGWTYGSETCGPACAGGTEDTAGACTDGCDNDNDGYTDCDDFNCCNAVSCGPTTSCGRRAMCVGCTSGTCPSGYECGSRACDARRACYVAGDPNASCNTVDGNSCPSTPAYAPCTTDAECGPLATCGAGAPPTETWSYGWTMPRCNHTLGCQGMAGGGCSLYGDNPCPSPPDGYPGVTPACAITGDSLRGACYGCVLQCNAGSACPYGLHCSNGRCID